MPTFNAFALLKWMHFVALAVAGGGAVACLLVSGFEETREDLRGLAAALWSRVVSWAFRLALLTGIALLVLWYVEGLNPFVFRYLWLKLPLALLAVVLSEMTPRALGGGKRGAAMLALFFFLLSSFVAVTRVAFRAPAQGGPSATVSPAP